MIDLSIAEALVMPSHLVQAYAIRIGDEGPMDNKSSTSKENGCSDIHYDELAATCFMHRGRLIHDPVVMTAWPPDPNGRSLDPV